MTRLPSTRLLFLIFLPSIFVLSACDSGGSNQNDIKNEFSLTITPKSSSSAAAVSKSSKKDLNGYSFFVDTDDVEEVSKQAFVIYLNGKDSFSKQNATQGLFGFLARNSGQPGTGDYTIMNGSPTSSQFVSWLYEDLSNTQSAPYYLIHDGTLSLSTSTDRKVAGSISGTATKYTVTSSGVTTDTVDVSGTFTAKNLDTYVPFSNYTNPPSP